MKRHKKQRALVAALGESAFGELMKPNRYHGDLITKRTISVYSGGWRDITFETTRRIVPWK